MQIQIIENGGVTSPAGFTAGVAAAEIKYKDRLDVGLVVSERPSTAAGVFTKNQVVAAPVIVSRETLAGNRSGIRAVAVNAGNANAATGRPGLTNARLTQTVVAFATGCEFRDVLLMSTGVIGVPLPMERVQAGVQQAAGALSADNGVAAAQAIMTTDTHPKHLAVQIELTQGTVTIGGMAKGAGMIHPHMATMLALLTTDAAVAAPDLQEMLETAVNHSFNRISVDGDTSTNDTVLLLANGAAGAAVQGEEDRDAFLAGLTAVCTELAQMIVRDGEGATKFAAVRVTGAVTQEAAHRVANTIATSPLVKTALAGSDANWGRILAAAGRSGVQFEQNRVGLWIGNPGSKKLQLVAGGTPTGYTEEAAAQIFAQADIEILLDLGQGEGTATVWTCDLTHDYVSINADYRS